MPLVMRWESVTDERGSLSWRLTSNIENSYSIQEVWRMMRGDWEWSDVGVCLNDLRLSIDNTSLLRGTCLLSHEVTRLIPGLDSPDDLSSMQAILKKAGALPVPAVMEHSHPRFKDLNELVFHTRKNNTFLSFLKKWETSDKVICLRCGSREVKKTDCPRCGGTCYVCQACLRMGESKSCTPLFLFPSSVGFPRKSLPYVTVKLNFSLTKCQQEAELNLLSFVTKSSSKKALVYAVCGAGKTETVFQAISHTLTEGGQVLFATPRRELVLDLKDRLTDSFPGLDICSLYGGSEEKDFDAPLIIATTHQVMRFYQAFSLVVLDELDAFPFKGSELLPKLLMRALKREGKLIYITATPEKSLLQEAKKDELTLVTIPARHHGSGAPVPILKKANLKRVAEGKARFPRQVSWLLTASKNKKPLLVFIPAIRLLEPVKRALKELASKLVREGELIEIPVIETIYSGDQEKQVKRDGLKSGEINIMVTTTVMERGITIPSVQVLVLFSNHRLFDNRTLIQIAGRCGRVTEDPTGEVLFVGDRRITPEMKEARRMIIAMNREAASRGFIT